MGSGLGLEASAVTGFLKYPAPPGFTTKYLLTF